MTRVVRQLRTSRSGITESTVALTFDDVVERVMSGSAVVFIELAKLYQRPAMCSLGLC